LIAVDFGESEVLGLGVSKLVSTYRGRGVHGLGFGEVYACMALGVKEFKEQILFEVVGAGRIAGGRADPLVLLSD
jgi:hypothetical protein